jgi:hypothetical protein
MRGGAGGGRGLGREIEATRPGHVLGDDLVDELTVGAIGQQLLMEAARHHVDGVGPIANGDGGGVLEHGAEQGLAGQHAGDDTLPRLAEIALTLPSPLRGEGRGTPPLGRRWV